MARNKTTIRFWHRTDRANKNGTAPIHLIYQVQGSRRYFAVPDELLLSSNWNDQDQRAVYISKGKIKGVDSSLLLTNTEVNQLNEKLSDLCTDIKALENTFRERGKAITASAIIDSLKDAKGAKTRKEQPTRVMFEFIDQYIKENAASRVKGSLSVYRSLKAHLEAFETDTNRSITFDTINYAFFQSFQNFLIGRRKIVAGTTVPMLNNTTIAKQLSTLKTFINYAKLQGIEIPDSYKQFKIKREAMEVVALTNEEFESLFYLDLTSNKRLEQVRDVFCFACVTGLRYSDLEQLKMDHIKEDEICLTVKKTRERLTIPLNPYSIAILKKYSSLARPLPIISNQKMNDYLKELCKIAGIAEMIEIVRYRGATREAITYPKYDLIGVHTARKTFATLSLEKGMSAEEVMSITGHKDYKSFKRYVNVTEQRKKVVMTKAWGDKLSDVVLKIV